MKSSFKSASKRDVSTAESGSSVVLIHEDGTVHRVLGVRGSSWEAKNMARCMPVGEWSFLCRRRHSFDSLRLLVDTAEGLMLIFCWMQPQADALPGILLGGDRREQVLKYLHLAHKSDSLSVGAEQVIRKETEAMLLDRQLWSLTDVSAEPMDGGWIGAIRRWLDDWSSLIGCRNRLYVAPILGDVPNLDSELFSSVMLAWMLFLRRFSVEEYEISIGMSEGQPLVELSCALPEAAFPLTLHRRHRHWELKYCDQLAADRRFFFTCWEGGSDGTPLLRASFSPVQFPFDRLRIKERSHISMGEK